MTSRRDFLGQLAAGAAGLAGLEALTRAHIGLQQSLPQDPVDFGRLRDSYLLDAKVTYLNHASIGTMPRIVHEARTGYLVACETNPWLHIWGGAWEAARDRTRELAAEMMGGAADEIAITHNTTEGFNLLAAGLPLADGDEVLFSSLNHAGATHCFEHQGARRGYAVRKFDFPIDDAPGMTADDVVAAYLRELGPKTRVLVFPHIDNMIGLRHPVAALATAARERGVQWVLVDGAQAVGMLPVKVAELGVDAYATSPHKWLQSPKGLGLLWLKPELHEQVDPMWVTWGQTRWAGSVRVFEDYGTRNLPEVLALGDAIEFQQRLGAERVEQHLRMLHRHMRAAIADLKGVRWRSPREFDRGASLYALEIEGQDSREVFAKLWPKHGMVVRAFHQTELNGLRVSPNALNTTADLDRFCAVLRDEVLG